MHGQRVHAELGRSRFLGTWPWTPQVQVVASALVKFAPGGGSVLWSTTIQPGGCDGYLKASPMVFMTSRKMVTAGTWYFFAHPVCQKG